MFESEKLKFLLLIRIGQKKFPRSGKKSFLDPAKKVQLKVAFCQKVMADFQIAQKSAENYPELLHPVQSNDKILILN